MTPPLVNFLPSLGDTPLQVLVASPTTTGDGAEVRAWDAVSNTGLEIITTERWNGVRWSTANSYWRPRLFNGAESVNSGATSTTGDRYEFASSTACRSWWDNYIVTIEMEGTVYSGFGDPVDGACQTAYINVSPSVIPLSVAEDCKTNDSDIIYRVYGAS